MAETGRNMLRGCRVLVAEDEYLIAADIAEALSRAGATVVGPISTVSGAERLAEDSGGLDAAVLDVSLRGEMAWSVADKLALTGVPFVFTTGYDRRLLPDRHAQAPFVSKPVMMGAVVDALIRQISRGSRPAGAGARSSEGARPHPAWSPALATLSD